MINSFGLYHPQPQQPHRALSPTLSQGSTNLGSNIGSITGDVDGKEKEVWQTSTDPVPSREEGKARICGLSKTVFWLLIAAVFLLVVGLGAGLGAGLGIKHTK